MNLKVDKKYLLKYCTVDIAQGREYLFQLHFHFCRPKFEGSSNEYCGTWLYKYLDNHKSTLLQLKLQDLILPTKLGSVLFWQRVRRSYWKFEN